MTLVVMPEATFAEYLRDLLKRKRISQTQLAAYIEASPPAVVDWLAGKRRPGPKFVWRIAKYDRRSFVDLMRLADHIPTEEDETELGEPEIVPELAERIAGLSDADQRWLLRVLDPMLVLREESAAYDASPPEPGQPEGGRQ